MPFLYNESKKGGTDFNGQPGIQSKVTVSWAARGGYFFMYSIKIPTTIPTKTSISDKISKSDINFALPSKISTEWILMQFG